MQQLKERTKVKQVWVCFNHMPYGNVVAQHFEWHQLERRTGDSTTERIIFTAEEQIESFKKSDHVALCLFDSKSGETKLMKNELLIYPPEHDLLGEPKAADIVLAWAKEQGVVPYENPDLKKKDLIDSSRVNAIEGRVSSLEKTVRESSDKIDQILAAVTRREDSIKAPKQSSTSKE